MESQAKLSAHRCKKIRSKSLKAPEHSKIKSSQVDCRVTSTLSTPYSWVTPEKLECLDSENSMRRVSLSRQIFAFFIGMPRDPTSRSLLTNGNIYNPHSLNGFKKFVPGFVDIIISRRDGVGVSVAGIYEVRGGIRLDGLTPHQTNPHTNGIWQT
ncbi:hypothetical protein TWF569_005386 [Orbilia oligospora]|nr:hypothetical protein TWF103_001225 [Orbilia oligospora]KAF3148653.1 hypothetical protein TWF569_005386 [Orbilia oligospora]